MDPGRGRVLLDGVDLREISETALRSSVVLVPQEGFLFDDTLAANARYGQPGRHHRRDRAGRRCHRPR
ncbi:hypothetical protein [Nocardioides convexus]|uniref:hypothetical protein n=1 Tax=Nocardioides convexus TaxID=2712224 RepID=UPI0024185D69|nr:hypothetical protein [Nocardioides convexus]